VGVSVLPARVQRHVARGAVRALDLVDRHVAGPGEQLADPLRVVGVLRRPVVRPQRVFVLPPGVEDVLAGFSAERA